MGKLYLYGAGRACQSMCCSPLTKFSSVWREVKPFRSIDNTEWSALIYNPSNSGSSAQTATEKSMFWANGLTAVVSADDTFNLSDYVTNAIANVTISVTSSYISNSGRLYTIVATNNNGTAINVSSIKFTKNLSAKNSSTSSDNVNSLICGYFLDNPVTIEAGATKTFAVNIDFFNY